MNAVSGLVGLIWGSAAAGLHLGLVARAARRTCTGHGRWAVTAPARTAIIAALLFSATYWDHAALATAIFSFAVTRLVVLARVRKGVAP